MEKNIIVSKITSLRCDSPRCNKQADYKILSEEKHTIYLCESCFQKRYKNKKVCHIYNEAGILPIPERNILPHGSGIKSFPSFGKSNKEKIPDKKVHVIGAYKMLFQLSLSGGKSKITIRSYEYVLTEYSGIYFASTELGEALFVLDKQFNPIEYL